MYNWLVSMLVPMPKPTDSVLPAAAVTDQAGTS